MSKSPHGNTPQGKPNDGVGGRDLADFIAGSSRLDPETQLPLPEEQDTPTSEATADSQQAASHIEQSAAAAETTAVDHAISVVDEDLNPELRDRAEVIGTGVRWFTGWCVRFIILIGAGYVALNAFGKLWSGLLPIILSIIVCTFLWPVVSFLRKLKVPNSLAVITTILGFFGAVIGVFWAIAPSAVSQSRDLAKQANEGIRQVRDWLQGPPINLQASQFNDGLDKAMTWLQERSGQLAAEVAAVGSATASAVVTFVIVLVLTFFFLKDGEKFLPTLRRVTGRRVGWHLTEALTRSWITLGGFVRTQAIVSFVDAFFIGIGLVILGVPLAGALAVLTFFAGFIPMIGAFAAGALSVLIALVANGPTNALMVLILIIAVQQLESNILQPVLQAKAMNVHPVLILLSITLGGTLFNIMGAFLAVPVVAVLMVILRYLGDMTDLATGERTADEIEFVTRAGSLTGQQNEQAAKRWHDLKENLTGNVKAPFEWFENRRTGDKQLDKQSETQLDKQSETQLDKQSDKQSDKQKNNR